MKTDKSWLIDNLNRLKKFNNEKHDYENRTDMIDKVINYVETNFE